MNDEHNESWINVRLLPVIVLLALLASCSSGGDATAPVTWPPISSVIGQFDLVEYDGAALPASLGVTLVGLSTLPGDTRTYNCPKRLTAASIKVASDSSVIRTSHIAYPCTGTLPHPSIPDSAVETDGGTVKTTGDSLTFTYVAASGARSNEYGRVSGTDLVFYLITQGSGVTSSFGPIHRVYRKK